VVQEESIWDHVSPLLERVGRFNEQVSNWVAEKGRQLLDASLPKAGARSEYVEEQLRVVEEETGFKRPRIGEEFRKTELEIGEEATRGGSRLALEALEAEGAGKLVGAVGALGRGKGGLSAAKLEARAIEAQQPAVQQAGRAAATQTATASSRVLGKNLETAGLTRPPGTAAHHIVAGTSPKAIKARGALERFEVDINSTENGVFLPARGGSPAPGASHPRLHTNKYFDEVNVRLDQAATRDEAVQVLRDIRDELMKGMFPY